MFNIDATDWLLVATKGSKYAHAPNWTVHSSMPSRSRAACGQPLPLLDIQEMSNRNAEGKPPCPRCVQRLRHHARWLTEWVESYENLTWPKEER